MREKLVEYLKENDIDVISGLYHIGNNEELYVRFLHMFPNDPTQKALEDAYKEKDYDKILIAAHALKGIGANLGFTRINEYAVKAVDLIRSDINKKDEINYLLEKEMEAYHNVCNAIKGIKNIID